MIEGNLVFHARHSLLQILAHLLSVFLGEAVHDACLTLPRGDDLANVLHDLLVLLLNRVGDVGAIEGVRVSVGVVQAQSADAWRETETETETETKDDSSTQWQHNSTSLDYTGI